MATMAPSPVSMRDRLKDGEARKAPHSQHDQNQDQKNEPECEKRPSAIPKLLPVPENRGRFRSRNVLSLVSNIFIRYVTKVKSEAGSHEPWYVVPII